MLSKLIKCSNWLDSIMYGGNNAVKDITLVEWQHQSMISGLDKILNPLRIYEVDNWTVVT